MKKKIIVGLLGATCLFLPTQAKAVCGDVNNDTFVNLDDAIAILNHSAEITVITDTGQLARGNVGDPTATVTAADDFLNLDDAITILKKSALIIPQDSNLNCNESIVANQVISVPIRYAATGGAPTSVKGFQATVTVTGATLVSSTADQLKAVKGWNTCAMNTSTGKVLCVDTTGKIAAASTSTIATVKVQAPASGQFTVTVGNALQVATDTGATTAATGIERTLTYNVGQLPPE